MTYVNASVAAVPQTAKADYLAFAEQMSALFKKHGATEIRDCWEDDVSDGEVTSFPMAVQRKEGESVVVSWIVWPDKATHDEAWGAMMSDPLMSEEATMPFDGKRMIFGGFETVVEA